MERSTAPFSMIGRLARGGAIVALAVSLAPLAAAQDATPDAATPS